MRDGKGEDVPEGVAWTDYPKSIGFLAGKLVPRGSQRASGVSGSGCGPQNNPAQPKRVRTPTEERGSSGFLTSYLLRKAEKRLLREEESVCGDTHRNFTLLGRYIHSGTLRRK